jgi:hypothetical protein
MTQYGFAGWYRKPGYDGWPSSEAKHMHLVYAGCAMKLALRNQMRDWFVGKNGLTSHAPYAFYEWPQASRDRVKALFLTENPASN